MQKWEYCAIVGLAKEGRRLNPYHPALWLFTPEGCKVSEIKGAEADSVAMTIAKFGNDGWEMVGAFNMFERAQAQAFAVAVSGSGALLFKRPKPDVQETPPSEKK